MCVCWGGYYLSAFYSAVHITAEKAHTAQTLLEFYTRNQTNRVSILPASSVLLLMESEAIKPKFNLFY